MKTKSFFSLLAGLAAGAALGVLYAPDKGSNTRARVKKAAEDGLGEFGDKAAAKEEEAEKSLKTLKETIREKYGAEGRYPSVPPGSAGPPGKRPPEGG